MNLNELERAKTSWATLLGAHSNSLSVYRRRTYFECFKNFVVYAYLSNENPTRLAALEVPFFALSPFHLSTNVSELNSLKQFMKNELMRGREKVCSHPQSRIIISPERKLNENENCLLVAKSKEES